MPDPRPMMKCGHAANAVRSDGSPGCVICIGFHPGADVIDDEAPSLEGRRAICSDCSKTVPSGTHLAFFEHRPLLPTDDYYCGCHGWD